MSHLLLHLSPCHASDHGDTGRGHLRTDRVTHTLSISASPQSISLDQCSSCTESALDFLFTIHESITHSCSIMHPLTYGHGKIIHPAQPVFDLSFSSVHPSKEACSLSSLCACLLYKAMSEVLEAQKLLYPCRRGKWQFTFPHPHILRPIVCICKDREEGGLRHPMILTQASTGAI